MRFRRGNENGNNTNITGHGNQVNTGRVDGDMRNLYVSGGASDPRILAAQSELAKLTAALDSHATEVHNIDGCRSAVARIDEELRSPAPDHRRLRETLEMLTLAVGSVSSVVTAAETLKSTIERLAT